MNTNTITKYAMYVIVLAIDVVGMFLKVIPDTYGLSLLTLIIGHFMGFQLPAPTQSISATPQDPSKTVVDIPVVTTKQGSV